MKTRRILATRLGIAALLAVVAASALAQGPGGPGGPPPGGGMGGGMRGGPPAVDRLPSLVRLATRPEVVADLGLSDDTVAKIEAIAEAGRPARGQGGPGQGGPGQGTRPDPEARAKAEAAGDAKVRALLSATQAKRLEEIGIQSMGLTAAMVPSVQAKLGLSDAQKTKLKALVPARGQGGPGGGGPGGPPPGGDMGGGFGGPPPDDMGGQGGPGGRGQDRPGGMNGGRQALEKGIAAILTADQKATLKALGGKTIKLSPDRGGPGEGRGPGGPGGPPPDGGF